jgi:hypothetical protein
MLTTNATAELLTVMYAAFNRREIEKLMGMMHPQVDWPNAVEGGRIHGRAGVREYWWRQWSTLNPQVTPMGFENDPEGRTVVEVHQLVRDLSGNILVDRNVQHIYTIVDGLVTRMDVREIGNPPNS